jgi:hypothetical protein
VCVCVGGAYPKAILGEEVGLWSAAAQQFLDDWRPAVRAPGAALMGTLATRAPSSALAARGLLAAAEATLVRVVPSREPSVLVPAHAALRAVLAATVAVHTPTHPHSAPLLGAVSARTLAAVGGSGPEARARVWAARCAEVAVAVRERRLETLTDLVREARFDGRPGWPQVCGCCVCACFCMRVCLYVWRDRARARTASHSWRGRVRVAQRYGALMRPYVDDLGVHVAALLRVRAAFPRRFSSSVVPSHPLRAGECMYVHIAHVCMNVYACMNVCTCVCVGRGGV